MGVIFSIDGQPAGLELLETPDHFAEAFPRILRAFGLSALQHPRKQKSGPSEPADEFLRHVMNAEVRPAPSVGLGEDLSLDGPTLSGTALSYNDRLLHLAAFSKDRLPARLIQPPFHNTKRNIPMSDNDSFDLVQQSFTTQEFAENAEPRCPCVLLLDTSYSMSGKPIQELNDGYRQLVSELCEDAMASKRVELAVVTFGPVELHQDFATPNEIFTSDLQPRSDTPMGQAINLALSELEERKNRYRQEGISYYRPWIFLITDGAPTDNWQGAASAVKQGEADNNFAFFAVGVDRCGFRHLVTNLDPPAPQVERPAIRGAVPDGCQTL